MELDQLLEQIERAIQCYHLTTMLEFVVFVNRSDFRTLIYAAELGQSDSVRYNQDPQNPRYYVHRCRVLCLADRDAPVMVGVVASLKTRD